MLFLGFSGEASVQQEGKYQITTMQQLFVSQPEA